MNFLSNLLSPSLDKILTGLTKLETKLAQHADKVDVMADKAAQAAKRSRDEAVAHAAAADRARRVASKVRGLID